MPIRILEPEQDLIRRVLQFANLRELHSTEQVESLLGKASLVRGQLSPIDLGLPGHEERVAAAAPVLLEQHRGAQTTLRGWLTRIVDGTPADRFRVVGEVDRALAKSTSMGMFMDDPESDVPTSHSLGVAFENVLAVCALAAAFILDKSRGLTARLGQCRKPGCGRFNLTFEGRPRFFCNDAHRVAYHQLDTSRRVREHRERKRREKRKGGVA